ncbi:MAG: hypothetical protein ACI4XJ_01890 [Eubacteriales bacterium]
MGKNTDGNNEKKSENKKFDGFDENMFPQGEKFNSAPGIKPFTKFRAVEMVLCAAAVVIGLLYLYTDAVTLSVLLPCYSVGMAVITVMRYFDMKATNSTSANTSANTGADTGAGFIAKLPVIFSALLTVLVLVVTALYFRGA